METTNEFENLFLLAAKHIRQRDEENTALRSQLSSARVDTAWKAAQAKLAKDPKQIAKWEICSQWCAWGQDGSLYASQDQFIKCIRDMPNPRYDGIKQTAKTYASLLTEATIKTWCIKWKNQVGVRFDRKQRKWLPK